MLIVAHSSPDPCCSSPSFGLNSGTVSIRGPGAGEVGGLAGPGIGAHQQAIRRVAGSRGTNNTWNAAKDAGSQSAPRRHGRMQLLRTTGFSEQEGDREAHQGEPSQTGGSKNG